MADPDVMGELAAVDNLPPDLLAPPRARITIGGPRPDDAAATDYRPDAFEAAAEVARRRYPNVPLAVLPESATEGPLQAVTSLGRGLAAAPGNVGRVAETAMGRLADPNFYATQPPPAVTSGGMQAPPYVAPGQGSLAARIGGTIIGAPVKSVIDRVMLPGKAISGEFNPFEQDSEAADWAAETAMGMIARGVSGGAPAGSLGAFGGRLSQPTMGALADPLWSDLSAIKLRKPIAEMQAERIATRPAADTKIISPEDLKIGTVLYPALGDRSIAGEQLLGVGGQRLRAPVDLQGGPGFITRNAPYVWANDQGEVTKMTNRINAMKDRGDDVLMSYFPMAPRSVDFSHHMSDTLVGMLPNATLKRTEAAAFNDIMRGAKVHDVGPLPDFPGLRSPNLQEYFAEVPGAARNKFAKLMDTSRFQNAGFPNVAEARYAVTDPTLLHEPYGASGGMFMRPNMLSPVQAGIARSILALAGSMLASSQTRFLKRCCGATPTGISLPAASLIHRTSRGPC